jgi:hypothetical protein
MIGAEMVPETPVVFNQVTRLIARKDFSITVFTRARHWTVFWDQLKSFHTFTSHFFKIQFQYFPPEYAWFSKVIFPFHVFEQKFLVSPMHAVTRHTVALRVPYNRQSVFL